MKTKKDRIISVRCTDAEYKKLKSQADKKQQSISELILDNKVCRRVRRAKDKQWIPKIVVFQEHANQIIRYLDRNPGVDPILKNELNEIVEEAEQLWAL